MSTDATSQPWLLPFAGGATADDILYCFRLILGRNPNREEWTGHLGHVGQPLAAVTSIYLNSLEFAARDLMSARPHADAPLSTAQLDGFKLIADPADAAVGRHALAGAYEPKVGSILRRVLRPGMGMIDIGANIGVFALQAAARVGAGGYVLAVEPNPANTRLLEASRRLNGFDHLVVCQAAASHTMGLLGLHAANSNGTTSQIGDELLARATPVAALRVDDLVPAAQRIDLIKIDVEGAEYNALRGAERLIRRSMPMIISEFSPGQLVGISGIDGPGYLAWLGGLGYAISVVGQDAPATAMPPAAVMAAYEAHGTDHIDIVCVPIGGVPGDV